MVAVVRHSDSIVTLYDFDPAATPGSVQCTLGDDVWTDGWTDSVLPQIPSTRDRAVKSRKPDGFTELSRESTDQERML